MNYYQALQREDGRWDYTQRRDSQIWAIGYCQGWEMVQRRIDRYEDHEHPVMQMDEERIEKLKAHKDKFHDNGHATKEGARACYQEYLLDFQLDLDSSLQTAGKHTCMAEGCEEETRQMIPVGSYFQFLLCPEHQNREEVDELLNVTSMCGST